MPTKSDRRKHRVYRKSAKETRLVVKSGKATPMECALCKDMLHGVPHGKKTNALKKLSKTQRRPSVPFAGILCGNCREQVAIETIKVATAQKKFSQVELRIQPYVKQLQASVN